MPKSQIKNQSMAPQERETSPLSEAIIGQKQKDIFVIRSASSLKQASGL